MATGRDQNHDQEVLTGIGVSPGIAFGRASRIDRGGFSIPDTVVEEADRDDEVVIVIAQALGDVHGMPWGLGVVQVDIEAC